MCCCLFLKKMLAHQKSWTAGCDPLLVAQHHLLQRAKLVQVLLLGPQHELLPKA
jgi:hypothetical protein